MVLAYKSLFDFELISVHGAREDLPLLFYMYNQESETVRMVRKGIKNPVVNLAVMASCYLQVHTENSVLERTAFQQRLWYNSYGFY